MLARVSLGVLLLHKQKMLLKRCEYFFCFRFPSTSTLPRASSAASAQPGSIVFLVDPLLTVFSAATQTLCVFPAFGSKKSSFFAPKSTVWDPPKPLQSLAVNTDPIDIDMQPLSPSPVATPVLPDIIDRGTLTSPVPCSSVACYTDSFADLEFAALLKDTSELENIQATLTATQAKLGYQKGLFARIERDFKQMKQNYEATLKDVEARTVQKRIDDRNIADFKDTINDLKKQVCSNQRRPRRSPDPP